MWHVIRKNKPCHDKGEHILGSRGPEKAYGGQFIRAGRNVLSTAFYRIVKV